MPSSPGLAGLSLHHVGYAVKAIAPAAEMYVGCLGYEVRTHVIHDPLQTALVQFLRLPGDAAYLELVAPDGPESKLARTVQRRGGLHHVCYACGPLEPAIDHLSKNGMLLFSDPKPATAFAGRRICWLMGGDSSLIELVERRDEADQCTPGLAP
jgi:methylmalonyl-CoA/ethylmalonyl-CoA epimerase